MSILKWKIKSKNKQKYRLFWATKLNDCDILYVPIVAL